MILVGGISLFVEVCYLAMNRWRVSLAYLLLVTTYMALTVGAAMTAFKVSRYLFAESALHTWFVDAGAQASDRTTPETPQRQGLPK
jgi:hypothetical protein